MSVNNLRVKQVINASGKMSILGVSTLSNEVMDAMKLGAQHFYEMEQLIAESGKIIANYMHTESALITNSASAAIALSVAGLVTKDSFHLVEDLHERQLKKEIIMMKGHMINYGAPIKTMVQLGGAEVKEVGHANGCHVEHIKRAVTENTVGILFVQSHHCVQKNMPSIKEVSEFAKKNHLPLIIDIAAEESFTKYATLADIVILSGSKALEGPTSGILAGKTKYVQYAKHHLKGIGRAMKVGKESIFGLLKAFEDYGQTKMTKESQLSLLNTFSVLNDLPGVNVTVLEDDSGRPIYRTRIQIDEIKAGYSATEVTKGLKQGEVAIYTRDYNKNLGHFDIDPRALSSKDVEMIVSRIKQILGG